MADAIDSVRFQRSSMNPPNERKESVQWGGFVRYLEFGDDRFALRQVDQYENGYLLKYDREQWADQFGALADFRFGVKWIENWGQPMVLAREEFEAKWQQATQSEKFIPKRQFESGPPPWIMLFESGKWQGQP